MNFLSLFAGIGGIDLGLEWAGMKCVGQVEINDYCRAVLAKHWPNVPRFKDVRDVRGTDFGVRIDLVAGGFPCQDISNAGTTHEGGLRGLSGGRSGLWSEFYRLVCEIQPRWVLVENVGALSVRGLGRVLHDLASGGFDADWATIPASALGAPHHRNRLYIVGWRCVRHAYEMIECPCCGEEPYCEECGCHYSECCHPGPHSWPELLEDSDGEGLEGSIGSLLAQPDDWRQNADVARSTRWGYAPAVRVVADGILDGLAGRRQCLEAVGNAVVPQVAEWIGRRILEAEEKLQSAKNSGTDLAGQALEYEAGRPDVASTEAALTAQAHE